MFTLVLIPLFKITIMRTLSSILILLFTSLFPVSSYSQNVVISGNVTSTNNEPLTAVSITVKGSGSGTTTDDRGNFKLSSSLKPPLTLLISSVGYALQEVMVSNPAELVRVSLVPSNSLGQEVVKKKA